MRVLCAILLFFFSSSTYGSDAEGSPIVSPMTPAPSVQPVRGITGTGLMAGTISNLGNIYVNGFLLETDATVVSVNGHSSSIGELRVGQFVVVQAEIEKNLMSGVASTIKLTQNVIGPVEAIDVSQNFLLVLGQTVHVDSLTSFDNSIPDGSIDEIQVGDFLAITGLVDSDGSITATRVASRSTRTTLEVVGAISNLSEISQQFSINGLTVDFSDAIFDDSIKGTFDNGATVAVKGVMLPLSSELKATTIVNIDATLLGTSGDYAEIRSFVTDYSSTTNFDVAGFSVITNGSTEYVGGLASEVGLNSEVEVEGEFNDDGTVIATKLIIQHPATVRIEAPIEALDSITGSITVLGVEVDTSVSTRFEDKLNDALTPLTLGNLNVGDYLEIRGVESPDGSVSAALVEREDTDDRLILQGFVAEYSDPAITVLGVTIDTNSAEFSDAFDNTISREEFFGQLTEGSLVKARGTVSGTNSLIADDVEFEIED